MKIHSVVLASLATMLLAGNAFACADTLYRVGKGVSYRVYTAPLPGSVLVYGQGDGAEQLAQAEQQYDRVMLAEQDEIKHYLKAIHRALKQKG